MSCRPPHITGVRLLRRFSKRKTLFPDPMMSRLTRTQTVNDVRAAHETNARQLISMHWCANTPPPLGSVLRVVKFELGDQSPKLNLVTIS
jgi:hypothetical protein